MGNLVFQATLGGQVNLVGPNTASTFNLNVPAVSSTISTTSGTETLTNKTLTTPVINGFTGDTSVVNIGSGQFYKDTAGNIGVGVTPSAWYTTSNSKAIQLTNSSIFDYQGSITNFLQNAYLNTSGGFVYSTTAAATRYFQTAGTHAWSYAASGTAGNAITFTQAMTLDASGRLLVGTTSGISNSKLSVKGAANYDGSITADNSSTTGGGWLRLFQNGVECGYFSVRGNILGSSAKDLALSAETGLGIYTYTNGGTAGPYVSSGGTSWTNSSDERLKNITGEIQNGLSKVCSLRAAEFTWKSDESVKPQVGLIAQDVQAVLPEAVSQAVINKDDETEYLGVSYTEVIPLLVAAIKELKAEIDTLKGQA